MLQPQSATRVRHQGPSVRLATPHTRPGTAAGGPGHMARRPPRNGLSLAPPTGLAAQPGQTQNAERTMRKNPPGDRDQGRLCPGVRGPAAPRPDTRRPAGFGRTSRRQEGRRRHRAAGDARRAEPHLPRPPGGQVRRDGAGVQPAAELAEVDVQDIGPSVQQAQPVSCLARFITRHPSSRAAPGVRPPVRWPGLGAASSTSIVARRNAAKCLPAPPRHLG